MTKSPPTLPERKLQRVLTISRADSIGVLVCSGSSLLLSLLAGDATFALFSALALAAGGMEAHGNRRLREGGPDGLQWLTGAQGCLYTVVVGYALWRLNFFDAAAYWEQVPAPAREQFEAKMREAGLDPVADRAQLLAFVNYIVCSVLLVVSTLYQGGLAFLYSRQRAAVLAALGYEAPRA